MAIWPKIVRPLENWARPPGVLSATSEAVGYEAVRAGLDDPAWPWWGTTGTETLTLAIGSVKDVDVVALIHPNVPDGHAITIASSGGNGLIDGAIAGSRQVNGYPNNVYRYVTGATASGITVAVAGAALDVAIGQLVVGKIRELNIALEPMLSNREQERKVIDDTDPTFGHTIRHDRMIEVWRMRARVRTSDAAFTELFETWQSTNGGTLPLLLIPPNERARLCRISASFGWTPRVPGLTELVTFDFEEISRGVLVQ